jgi:hypothetical protein
VKRASFGAVMTATAAVAIAWMASGATGLARDAPRSWATEERVVVSGVVTSSPLRSFASADTVVVRDDHIAGVYALRNILLYGRFEDRGGSLWPATDRPWMRVVGGDRRRVHGMPQGAAPFSIGRDRAGRVVVVLGRPNPGGSRIKRWWLYDVVRDAARGLKIRGRTGCAIRSVAVWRDRVAYQEQCRRDESNVVLRHKRRAKRLMRIRGGLTGSLRIALRNRFVAVIGGNSPEFEGGEAFDANLWRVLDRGRQCPTFVAGVVEEREIWAGLGSKTLTWVTANYEFDGMTFSGLNASHISLLGRCEATPQIRSTPASLLPQTPINANGPLGFNGVPGAGVAIDGPTVYYATDTGIHRLRLPT